MAAFGDTSTVYQRMVSLTGARVEFGGYTQATDATACIPTHLHTVLMGMCLGDGSTCGRAATGNVTNDTVDFSIFGGTGSFSGKEVQYFVFGY